MLSEPVLRDPPEDQPLAIDERDDDDETTGAAPGKHAGAFELNPEGAAAPERGLLEKSAAE